MELILTDSSMNDVRRLFDVEIDIDLKDTNTFELKIKRGDFQEDLTFGSAIYASGTEYGGIIGEIDTDTSLDTISLKGYTWRGMLDKKIIKPPPGEDYRTISGELNTVLNTLISEQFDSLFSVLDVDTGKTISNFQFNRYTTLLAGIKKMLKSVGYKLQIKFIQQEQGAPGYVELAATQIEDYSEYIELSQDDQLNFTFQNVRNGVNHLICLGTGELKNRAVVDLYLQKDGTIGTTQYYTGIREVAETYEDTNAKAEELEEKGRDHFLEVMNYTQFEMNVATLDVDIDIGDVIGGRDYLTGLYAKKPISGKIWRFADGVESIEYSVEGEDEEEEIA